MLRIRNRFHYSSYYGRFDTIVFELEFQTIAEMEQAWAEFDADPGTPELMARWDAATQPGGMNEVWVLEAQG